MIKYCCISFIILAPVAGCKRNEYLLFSDIARIQQADTTEMTYTFVYEAPAVVRDTVYIPVNTIGGITDKDRPVKLEQITEYTYTYVRDPVTNQITDTIATERPFKAVPGKHYVAFDDPSIASLMVIKANQPLRQLTVNPAARPQYQRKYLAFARAARSQQRVCHRRDQVHTKGDCFFRQARTFLFMEIR